MALLLPPLLALLGALVGNAFGIDELFAMALFGALGGLSFVGGLCVALLSPWLSARTRVEIDLASRQIVTRRHASPIPLSSVASVDLKRSSRATAFWHIEARRHDGPAVVLLGPLAQSQLRDAAALTNWLSQTLAVPGTTADPSPPLFALGAGDNTAGMLCYLPVQGIFLLASLYYLLTAKRRPFVYFCAVQSLSQFVFSFMLLVAVLVVLGVPVALAEGSPLQLPLAVALAAALTLFWFWNFGTHAYACFAAYKQRLWVMPWLRFWVRRFHPDNR
ncbi:MAG: hypothetical protein R3B13_14365 [Polyangiaceae bacterium]